MRRLLELLGLLLLVVPALAAAQIHMCKTPDGKKVYSDLPCPADAEKVTIKSRGGGPSINPGINVRTEHYDIRGTTWVELRNQIAGKGPEGFWGSAASGIGFELRAKPAGSGCAVVPESIRANAESVIRLPGWGNRYQGPAALQVYWDSVYRSLDLHERGHVQINLDGAKEIERVLHNMPPQPSCDLIAPEARRLTDQVRAQIDRRQVEYDRDTDHGRRQWTPYQD
ncbi:MAG: DUF922 domain-containing protein [Usitatibacter sp.]